MNPIRPFVKSDIPQVVELFQKAFFNNGQARPSSSILSDYFEELFFHNPWAEEESIEEGITSLVYETSDGAVIHKAAAPLLTHYDEYSIHYDGTFVP